MQHPEKIADFILRGKAGWSTEKRDGVLRKPKTSNIYTQEKMPVYLLYYTAWLGSNGQIVYGQDIYENDKKLMQALEKLDEYPKMDDNKEAEKITQFID